MDPHKLKSNTRADLIYAIKNESLALTMLARDCQSALFHLSPALEPSLHGPGKAGGTDTAMAAFHHPGILLHQGNLFLPLYGSFVMHEQNIATELSTEYVAVYMYVRTVYVFRSEGFSGVSSSQINKH